VDTYLDRIELYTAMANSKKVVLRPKIPFIQKLNYKVKNKHRKWIKLGYMSHIT
jgi:hypothetical protein